jgi:signal peptidase I
VTKQIESRSTGARIGVTALNLLTPGLGLLRLGYGRDAALLLMAPLLVLAASIALFALAPYPNLAGLQIFVPTVVVLGFFPVILSIVLTWRRGRVRRPVKPYWSHWYSLLLIWIAFSLVGEGALAECHSFYKRFYLPGESMAPTLEKDDRILADMRGGRHPAIGDILLVGPLGPYVKRVVALGGDRIAMKAGVPVVNGVAAIQRERGTTTFLGYDGQTKARLLQERLPGEIGSHAILDTEATPLDDMPEQIVPAGHLFVLGDNRDRSADSRVPIDLSGTGMVAPGHIVGRPLFVTWSRDRSKIGRAVVR